MEVALLVMRSIMCVRRLRPPVWALKTDLYFIPCQTSPNRASLKVGTGRGEGRGWMASRFFSIGTMAALTAMAAGAAVSSLRHSHVRPSVAPGSAHLRAFGSRSAQQRHSEAGAKFDGALAELSRNAVLARPDHAIEDLRSIAPGVRFKQAAADTAPLVLIDAVTRGDPQQLKSALVALGLQHPSVYSNDVGGWLPVSQLDAATARAEVHSIRAAMPHTRSGAEIGRAS